MFFSVRGQKHRMTDWEHRICWRCCLCAEAEVDAPRSSRLPERLCLRSMEQYHMNIQTATRSQIIYPLTSSNLFASTAFNKLLLHK
jgi:hypothetical protein